MIRRNILGAALASMTLAAVAATAQQGDKQERELVTCCVASGNCMEVGSEAECERQILAAPPTIGEGVDLTEARPLTTLTEAPRRIDLGPDTAEIVVNSCTELSKTDAPVPPGAVTLERLRWFSCEVEVNGVCGQKEPLRVAWPRYSDGHLGASPIHRDPILGQAFRVRFEVRKGWIRVRGAQAIHEFTEGVCE